MTHGAILRGSAILPLGYISRGDYHFVHNKNSFCVTVIIVIQQKKLHNKLICMLLLMQRIISPFLAIF